MKRWLALLLLVGCARHIYPYNKKVREYEEDSYAAPPPASAGSLWKEGDAGLLEDYRARRLGDILTIQVEERADATRDAQTETNRESASSLGVSALWNVMAQMSAQGSGINPAQLIAAASESNFAGGGATSRSGEVHATLPARIRKVLPNGDLFVEGNKVLLVNDEESYLYMSGVVRQNDIGPDNTVASSRVADVEFEYTGRGVLSERQSPGWFSRLLDYIWPF